ncbi:leucine-rich repeat receptor-like serine/threonine-protein kinase BAM1 [Cryptomeria japonica]|uniref:leucine-rich repeat receptor-like serine/threonine-protein kinase BAM1 n=1 Tax=Cryptomeria japonica TaxID=3369 RepID=UPI0027DA59FA|nr:leucine-rich repeat receptor-like serine/threonine-protein kinase BAM1 [Cryptomeria japonica]
MAIPSHKLFLVFMSLLLVFLFLSPRSSFSHPLLSTSCLSHESQALLRFKDALNISLTSSRVNLTSWVNGTDCCTNWTGISCDNHTNHVVSLDISYLFAEGVISESLCQLRFLTSLTIVDVFSLTSDGGPGTIKGHIYKRTIILLRKAFWCILLIEDKNKNNGGFIKHIIVYSLIVMLNPYKNYVSMDEGPDTIKRIHL